MVLTAAVTARALHISQLSEMCQFMNASHGADCTCISRIRRCAAAAGGFFASGFKRAFKMKDFGQTIPGHGGVTDRFDCQMIMAMFAYVYYWNYVASAELTVGDALDVSVACVSLALGGRGARHGQCGEWEVLFICAAAGASKKGRRPAAVGLPLWGER